MFELLAIISWLVALVGSGGLLLAIIFDDKKYIPYLIIPVVAIVGIWTSWVQEESYYTRYGNPYVTYAQVKALSDNKITVYAGSKSQKGDATDTFLRSNADFKGLHEEDIVRLTYFSGFYRDFTIKVERLVPEK